MGEGGGCGSEGWVRGEGVGVRGAQEYPHWRQVTLTTLGELYNEVRGWGKGGVRGG